MLNCPSNQSKPSSFRLFCVISTNFASISTCRGPETFACSTSASTSSRLSCVLRTISRLLCGRKFALAPGRKRHALRFEEILRSLAIHELTATGGFLGVLRRCPPRRAGRPPAAFSDDAADVHGAADEPRRHAIFLREQIIALLAHRNDRDRIWLDLDLQASLAGDVAQRFAERNLIQA